MIIECNYCKANVDAKVIATHESNDPEEPGPFHVSLVECPSCGNALVAGQYEWPVGLEGEFVLDKPDRMWPEQKKYISLVIPEGIRTSIEEAQRCLSGNAYIACTSMSGRALEGVCRHYKTKAKSLNGALAELKDREVIDSRLHEWGKELHKHRNIAAHAGDEKVNPKDASDLLDFVIAICEYIFVLTEKFDKFMARSEKKANK
ncbi:DUF4145 domain-containing protein [Vreelandella boliviensis]|uniref:DUF4145 domain-containing protein n=1 Tax=Vreelandella boliviensis TaxID=223527 RepID=UPI001B8AB1CF|nr:DUF4145 domain-containing protein [Halomonas boliviensis]